MILVYLWISLSCHSKKIFQISFFLLTMNFLIKKWFTCTSHFKEILPPVAYPEAIIVENPHAEVKWFLMLPGAITCCLTFSKSISRDLLISLRGHSIIWQLLHMGWNQFKESCLFYSRIVKQSRCKENNYKHLSDQGVLQ